MPPMTSGLAMMQVSMNTPDISASACEAPTYYFLTNDGISSGMSTPLADMVPPSKT